MLEKVIFAGWSVISARQLLLVRILNQLPGKLFLLLVLGSDHSSMHGGVKVMVAAWSDLSSVHSSATSATCFGCFLPTVCKDTNHKVSPV